MAEIQLTQAERAALPLISHAGLNLLKMHGLRVVAEKDIGTIQAAYLRVSTQMQGLVNQMNALVLDLAALTLACERQQRSDAWTSPAPGISTLTFSHGWRIETRSAPDGITASITNGEQQIAQAGGIDEAAALAGLYEVITAITNGTAHDPMA
jgi:hypothetical protein